MKISVEDGIVVCSLEDKNSKLKARREELGLTQKQVAVQLGISSQAYGHYENNKRSIPVEMVIPLAEILKIDIESLVRMVASLPLV